MRLLGAKPMTPRERLLAALAHREPDRVPVDLSGYRSSGISAAAYGRLRRHLDLELLPIRVYDPLQQLALVDEDVLDRFGVDTIELGRAFSRSDEDWTYWVLPDGTPCLMPKWAKPERDGRRWVLRSSRTGRVLGELPAGACRFEPVHFPFAEQDDWDSLPGVLTECLWTGVRPPPGPTVGLAQLSKGAARLRANSDRAILLEFGGQLWELARFLYGHERFCGLLAGTPERVHALLERLLEMHVTQLERILVAVGPYIDIVVFRDDFNLPQGPQMSPALYREFLQPCHRKLWSWVKELTGAKTLWHCEGDLVDLLPDVIEAGLDAISLGSSAGRGGDATRLKAEFGSRLTLWGGGCDMQHVLRHGTPGEVAEHVRQQLATHSPGGGFVFRPTGTIPSDVPPENIVAMFEHAINS